MLTINTVSVFFNFDAIKFILKPKYYDLLGEETKDLSSKMKNYGMKPVNELIKICQKLEVQFFTVPYGMKIMNVEESQLLDGTILAGETTFLDNAQDFNVVLTYRYNY